MSFLSELKKKRVDWVRANRENNFEEGILNLLTELYPDNAHFIYELLQNAEDAQATRVWFEVHPSRFLCRHNGQRRFTEANVEAITSIGKSTKKDDLNQIGKFGVGFKAVFSYTDSPRVYSGDFHFEILDLVCPNDIAPLDDVGTDTVFEFPFNKPGKLPDIAFKEVKTGLDELSETALLFLTNIEQISWQASDGTRASITRLAVSELQYEIEYVYNGNERRDVEWLRFADKVEGKPQHQVAIAFALELLEKPAAQVSVDLLGHRYRVKQCAGKVSIYFPAEKEASKLRFHIHAPFASTVARDSVRNRPENEPLIGQLALLLKYALHRIRAEGLLTTDFLEVLPLFDDNLSTFYAPLMLSVIEDMHSKPLTPTNAKGHAPAARLVQGSRGLKDLLSDNDLNYCLGKEAEPSLAWAVNAMQGSRAERFLKGLEIRVVSGEDIFQFIKNSSIPVTKPYWDQSTRLIVHPYKGWPHKAIDDVIGEFWKWLDLHDDPWMQRLYSTLWEIGKTSNVFVRTLAIAPIVRILNGSYLPGKVTYFPSDGVEDDPVFPRVRASTYSSGRSEQEKAAAKSFLTEVSVQTVGPREDIERILKTKYSGQCEFPSVAVHFKDMETFIDYWVENPHDSEVFKGFFFLLSDQDTFYCEADAAYLDTPYGDTGLAGLYATNLVNDERLRFGLSPKYLKNKVISKHIVKFSLELGVLNSIPISKVSTDDNPRRRLLQIDVENGAQRRDTGQDEDYEMEGLAELLKSPNVGPSRAIWLTMRNTTANVLIARFQANRQQPTRTELSSLVQLLRSHAWVALADGTFVTPDRATVKTLMPSFTPEHTNGWLAAVGFGESEKRQSDLFRKKELEVVNDGFSSLEEYESVRDAMMVIPAAQRKAAIEALRHQYMDHPPEERAFPERPIRNSELRESRVADEVRDTPEKTTRLVGRQVQIGYQEAKTDAREYLRQQYINDYQVMVCQLCQDEMPFKTLDGDYYFEAVAVVESLPKFLGKGFLCLCPNHAAMYRYSNADKSKMLDLIAGAQGAGVTVFMAGRERNIAFTDTHLADMQASLRAMNEPS
jgi:hypothetical protein